MMESTEEQVSSARPQAVVSKVILTLTLFANVFFFCTQTRRRLHAHCLVWIVGAAQLLEDLQSRDQVTTTHAQNKLKNLFDRTTSTKLMEKEEIPIKLFVHDDECNQNKRPKNPCVKDDQHLRDMRHKAGKNLHNGVVAECSECGHQYTLDELVVNCLNHLNAEAGSDEATISSWTKVQRCENEDELEGKKKLEELLFLVGVTTAKHLCTLALHHNSTTDGRGPPAPPQNPNDNVL